MNAHRKIHLCVKFVDWLIIGAFVSTSVIVPVPKSAHAANIPAPVQDLTLKAADIEKLFVPENFGMVNERYKSGHAVNGSKTIFLIQDSHANHEAQTNIAKLIESLASLSGVNVGMVLAEGGTGKLDTGFMRAETDTGIRGMIARYLLRIAYLSGVEFYAATVKESPPPLFGIEDRDLYYRNLEAYRKSVTSEEGVKEKLSDVKEALLAIRPRICSEGLSEIYEREDDYDSGALTFSRWCRYLAGKADELKIDTGVFLNFRTAIRAMECEDHFIPQKADDEKMLLVDELGKRAVKEEMAGLVEKSLLYRTGRMPAAGFYSYLIALGVEKGLIDPACVKAAERQDWEFVKSRTKYPDFIAASETVLLHSKIDYAKLFEEADEIAGLLKKKMFRGADEVDFGRVWNDTKLLTKLVGLKMTRAEIDYVKAHPESAEVRLAVEFIKKHGKGVVPPELFSRVSEIKEANAESALSFYGCALQRDAALYENAVKKMTEDNVQNAVIVAGGFHKDGIKEKIRKDGYSYVVIMPRMTQKYDDALYRAVMMGEKTPIERYLESVGTRLGMEQRTSDINPDKKRGLQAFFGVIDGAARSGKDLLTKGGEQKLPFTDKNGPVELTILNGEIEKFEPLGFLPVAARDVFVEKLKAAEELMKIAAKTDEDYANAKSLLMEALEILNKNPDIANMERDKARLLFRDLGIFYMEYMLGRNIVTKGFSTPEGKKELGGLFNEIKNIAKSALEKKDIVDEATLPGILNLQLQIGKSIDGYYSDNEKKYMDSFEESLSIDIISQEKIRNDIARNIGSPQMEEKAALLNEILSAHMRLLDYYMANRIESVAEVGKEILKSRGEAARRAAAGPAPEYQMAVIIKETTDKKFWRVVDRFISRMNQEGGFTGNLVKKADKVMLEWNLDPVERWRVSNYYLNELINNKDVRISSAGVVYQAMLAILFAPVEFSARKLIEKRLTSANSFLLPNVKERLKFILKNGIGPTAFPAIIAPHFKKEFYSEEYHSKYGIHTPETIRSLHLENIKEGNSRPVEIDYGGIKFTVYVDTRYFDEGLTEDDIRSAVMEPYRIFKELHPDRLPRLEGLHGRDISNIFFDRSPNIHEDHRFSDVFGSSAAVFKAFNIKAEKPEDREKNRRLLLLNISAGWFHEIRHECGYAGDTEELLAEESVEISMRLLAEKNMDVKDYMADLQNLFAVESVFFEMFIKMTKVFDLSKRIFIGNERLYNLYIQYAGRDNIFISDSHLYGDRGQNNKAVLNLFGKSIVTADHHYDDPRLQRETAASQMIEFLKMNTDPETGSNPFQKFEDPGYMTSHVDPDSMLAYFVSNNWSEIKENKAVLDLVQNVAYYTDFGGLEKKGWDAQTREKVRLFANILFGIQWEINKIGVENKEKAFEDLCGLILTFAGAIQGASGEVSFDSSVDLNEALDELEGKGYSKYHAQVFLDNRAEELSEIEKVVKRAIEREKIKYDETAGLLTIELDSADPPNVYNANIIHYLREIKYFDGKKAPVAIIQSRAPPPSEEKIKTAFIISLINREDPRETLSLAGLSSRLNALEPPETKTWTGRHSASSNFLTGSSLDLERVRETYLDYNRNYYQNPENYYQLARKIYDPLISFINKPENSSLIDQILENVPAEGGEKRPAPEIAEIILDGLLSVKDPNIFNAFVAEAKLEAYEEAALVNRQNFLAEYRLSKDVEPGKVSSLVDGALLEAVAAALYDGKKPVELAPEVLKTLKSPEFLAFFVATGVSLEKGNVIAFDKRNLFDRDGKNPAEGMDVYMRMLDYFAGKGAGAVIYDCLKDEKPLRNDIVDGMIDDLVKKRSTNVIAIERVGNDIVQNIVDRFKEQTGKTITAEQLSVYANQENFDYFRKWVGRFLSLLVMRPDGKLVDLSRKEIELVRGINPDIARGVEAGTIELLPPVNYDSTTFSQRQRAAIILGIAA